MVPQPRRPLIHFRKTLLQFPLGVSLAARQPLDFLRDVLMQLVIIGQPPQILPDQSQDMILHQFRRDAVPLRAGILIAPVVRCARVVPLSVSPRVPLRPTEHLSAADPAEEQTRQQVLRMHLVARHPDIGDLGGLASLLDRLKRLTIHQGSPGILCDDPVRLRPRLQPFILSLPALAARQPVPLALRPLVVNAHPGVRMILQHVMDCRSREDPAPCSPQPRPVQLIPKLANRLASRIVAEHPLHRPHSGRFRRHQGAQLVLLFGIPAACSNRLDHLPSFRTQHHLRPIRHVPNDPLCRAVLVYDQPVIPIRNRPARPQPALRTVDQAPHRVPRELAQIIPVLVVLDISEQSAGKRTIRFLPRCRIHHPLAAADQPTLQEHPVHGIFGTRQPIPIPRYHRPDIADTLGIVQQSLEPGPIHLAAGDGIVGKDLHHLPALRQRVLAQLRFLLLQAEILLVC
ncbi:MAG: hypothetical protein ABFD85_06700 [Phycisphaerae bacterium]